MRTQHPMVQDVEALLDRAGALVDQVWTWLVTTPHLWLAVVAGVVLYFALIFLRGVVILGLKRIDHHRDVSWPGIVESVIARSGNLFFLAVAIYLASRFIAMPANVDSVIRNGTIVVAVIQAAAWVSQLLVSLLRRHAAIEAVHDGPAATSALSLIQLLVRIFVWSTAFLLVLGNLGINVTALIAGLGIGGIAIGFAAQGILSDIFASLSIVIDKPFITGDFIAFGDMMGKVEHIGLKTTRIRSLSGEQIVVANGDLLSTRIRNYERMQERRVAFMLGVTYQTSPAKLEAIPGIVRTAIEAQPRARFDRVHFHSYGEFALLFEAVYWVRTPDYTVHMDIRHAINSEIFKRFGEAGIDFAYPTQTVHLAREVGGSGVRPHV